MLESNPLPYPLIALWLALPGIWLGAGVLTGALAADRAVRQILQPAAALAASIVAVQLASMIARSFWIGFPVGTISFRRRGSCFGFSVGTAGMLILRFPTLVPDLRRQCGWA
jgi:hypothetical protein